MLLPERRKTPEEIERLREGNLPAHVLPRMRASMGNEEILEQVGDEEVLPEVRVRARAIAGEFRYLLELGESGFVGVGVKGEKGEGVKISHEGGGDGEEVSRGGVGEVQVGVVSGGISPEEESVKGQGEFFCEEILEGGEVREEGVFGEGDVAVVLTKRVEEVATFRKVEEELGEDVFVVERLDLPVERRSVEELEQLRFLQSLEIRDGSLDGEMKVKMARRFHSLKAGVWLLMFCYLMLLLGPIGVLVGLWLGWKKPLSRHHAAILVILGTLVTLFGGLRAYDQVPRFRSVVDRAQGRVQKLFHF